MSYSRKYHETIKVRGWVEGYVDYPASQNGGRKNIRLEYTEDVPVDVNINVDTVPFDRSVAGCNNTVNVLTGAVTATEAAQIASIAHNAKKVGGTIVKGFFNTIRMEIDQQIMELSKRIEADLIHLKEMAKRCLEKQKQMENDYNGIVGRNVKLFNDLNRELENRIFELDKPAFVFKNQSDNHAKRTLGSDLASTVAVFGKEGGELQAIIGVSLTKKRALETINQANRYLWEQKKTEDTITKSMLNESVASQRLAPVCLIEMQAGQNQIDKKVYQPGFLPPMHDDEMIERFKNRTWISAAKEQKDTVQRYFNAEVSQSYSSGNQHDNRVREMMTKIFDVNSIKSV